MLQTYITPRLIEHGNAIVRTLSAHSTATVGDGVTGKGASNTEANESTGAD